MEHLLLTLILMSMFHLNSVAFSINEKSYFKVNKTAIAQARKAFMAFDTSNLQDPPMPPSSFSVYNLALLEKSKFKDYDSLLTNRLAQDQARATYLRSELRTSRDKKGEFLAHNSSKIFDQILKAVPISYYKGHYVATFMLGSERLRNFLLVDTASYLTWWQCEPCNPDKCYKPTFYTIYNYDRSNTFRQLDCVEDSATCVEPVFYCDTTRNKLCIYAQTYENGEKTKGFIASEIITFLSDNAQARITFGCGVDQKSGTSQFSTTFSGILGLSKRVSGKQAGIYSLPSQLGANLFALCLPSTVSTQPSFLTFNKAPWVYGTEAKLLKNRLQPHLYFVNLYKIFINDKEVPVDPSWWNGQKEDHGVIVDTGTLITHFPHDYYIVFRYIFRQQVQYSMLQYSIGPFDTCYKEEEGEEMYFPIIRFYFGNVSHTQEVMLVQDRVVANLQGYYCLAFLPWDDKQTVIGSHQLQGTGLTFDMKNNALTFSVDACD